MSEAATIDMIEIPRAEPGKYMSFGLGEERFALPILKVQEIISPTKVTRVPKSPTFVKGVMNLRGKIVPIIDLRERLGRDSRAYDERTCFVVVRSVCNNREVSVGLVVDCVLGVTMLNDIQHPNQIEEEFSSGAAGFISGIAIAEGAVNVLLDVDSMLFRIVEGYLKEA
ncbi:MAG: purine-binding chemotaxis protein CheW [Deltaproteobacteria bacterium]|nr:purine-binding chemotaxis protein CheW [Deltaproteobacteria bacterium]